MKRNDTKSPSQLKKPESIGWKKEIRKTPVDALEVMAKENELWQKERQKEIRHYKNLGYLDEKNYPNEKNFLNLPEPWKSMMRANILKTKMTKIEWQNYCIKQDMLVKKEREGYFDNNKMSEKVVNKILALFKDKKYVKEKLDKISGCPCMTCFDIMFHPVDTLGLSWDDWRYGLYDDLIMGQLNKAYDVRLHQLNEFK